MNHPEYRAVIAHKHILFNLADCFDKMSELDTDDYDDLLDWIAAGNNPDRFTGLCDSESVPIYENDILHCGESGISSLTVEWDNEGSSWGFAEEDEEFIDYHMDGFKITGNTHTAQDTTGGEG